MNNLIKFTSEESILEYEKKNKNWVEVDVSNNMFLYIIEDINKLLNLDANFYSENINVRGINYYYVDKSQLISIIEKYKDIKFIYYTSSGANLF